MKIKDNILLSDTPFIAVDLDVMQKNIDWLSGLARKRKVKMRPHTKTHKSPYIAHKQIEAGAIGITTATLGEAEVMVNAGIKDILIGFPLLGQKKLERFKELLTRADLIVALDDITVAKGINQVGEVCKKVVPIYIDVDTGMERMGKSPNESIDSILQIAKLPYLDIKGLMSHAGHAYAANDEEEVKRIAIEDATILQETKLSLSNKGLEVQEISVGASATARFLEETPFITEVRAGMYIFNDRMVLDSGGAKQEDCAVTVFATVVSIPSNDRLIIDAGSKTLSQDVNRYGGFGLIKNHENLTISRLSEEHGIIEVEGETDLRVGDIIEIIPNHVCPLINLTDEIYGFRGGDLERIIPIEGRGKNR